nr:polysaccharide export protein [Kaistella sp.]
MKKYFSVFIISALLAFTACKPKKNIVYLSNNNFEQEVSQAQYLGLHIQEGDQLQILVSAFDDIAVRPFNINTMNRTGTSGSGITTAGSNAVSPSEY